MCEDFIACSHHNNLMHNSVKLNLFLFQKSIYLAIQPTDIVQVNNYNLINIHIVYKSTML
jgi:hypothetical protein